MRLLKHLSIRTILGAVVGLMGALLLVTSGAVFVSSVERMNAARRVSVASATSRELFRTLLAIRLERGVLIGGLAGEAPIDGPAEVDIALYRRDAENGYAASLKLLATVRIPPVAETIPALRAMHDAVVAGRPQMDAALRVPKPARDVVAERTWPGLEQSYLDAITVTIDRLAVAVKFVDPLVDHLLAINRAAWRARLYSGLAVLRMQETVAAGKTWAPVDVVAYADERARAALAWSLVKEAAAQPGASATLRAQVETANDVFAGKFAAARKDYAARLAAGQTIDVPISELRRGDTEANGTIVDVAITAFDEMVARADATIRSARARLFATAMLLLASVLLFGGGVLIIDRRVTRPLGRLAAAMRTLVAGNHAIEIPDTDSGGEVGAFARTLELLKQNGLKIAHMARHDPLTELPNRAAFDQHFAATLDRARAGRTSFAVLCLDLDRFKEINDVFGHSVGDAALREACRRLHEAAPDAFLARLGGDEFVVISEGRQPDSARAVAERLQAALVGDIVVGDHWLHLGLSIGIAVFPGDGDDKATLIGNADAALYRAKDDGRGAIRSFTAVMDQQRRERRALQHDLRSAIARGELALAYQPQARIDGEIIGFEALARWSHPGRGRVPPAEFIPLAEECGLIVEIGEWVLREACGEAASWPRPLPVAVNVSAVQFRRTDLHRQIHGILLETGLPADRLELEITEGVLIENVSRAAATLRRLKAVGVRIALDDFGAGYSSLSYLQSFPLDRIKIDRSFVARLGRGDGALAIVRAVIGLAHGLDLPVIAEGVETEAQHELLVREHCDAIQGYWIGQPRAIDAYAGLLGRAVAAVRPALSAVPAVRRSQAG